MERKWIIGGGAAIAAITLLLLWNLVPAFKLWLTNALLNIVILAVTFVAGWIFGYMNRNPHTGRDTKE